MFAIFVPIISFARIVVEFPIAMPHSKPEPVIRSKQGKQNVPSNHAPILRTNRKAHLLPGFCWKCLMNYTITLRIRLEHNGFKDDM